MTERRRARLARVLPPPGLARRLAAQSVLFAIGQGTFTTGNAVFFTHIVGLSATQVGVGLTVSSAVSFALAVPMGRLVDTVGAKRMWALCALLEALLYFGYPWLHGFAAFLAMVVALAVVGSAGGSGRGAYTIDAFPREERVRSLAFMRSALNIGFTMGALFSGIALATGSDRVVQAVPLLTAVVLLLNSVLIARLPDAEVRTGSNGQARPSATTPRATRNPGFVTLSVCEGVLLTHDSLLTVVIPLWLVQETDAPRTLLAWLFATNTVLTVLLQVSAARGSHTVSGALRAARLCALCFVASCLLVMTTGETISWITIVLIWLGHIAITGAELFQSASQWGLVSELSDPTRRGEYQGVASLGSRVGSIGGPAAYTFLTIHGGIAGWLLIAALAVVAAAVLHPAAHAAERFLRRHGAEEHA